MGALQLAREVAANPRFGVEQTKELLQLGIDATSFAAATALENRTQVLASTGSEMANALAARRKRHLLPDDWPSWQAFHTDARER